MARPTKEHGDYYLDDIRHIFNSGDFQNERKLCDYIEENIESFCDELGIEMESYERESYIFRRFKFTEGNQPRIDFKIIGKDGKVTLVEVKNPKNLHREIHMAIGQVLNYILIAEKNGIEVDRAVLLTTMCDKQFLDVIKRFGLPIDVVLMSKGFMGVWKKEVV